MKRIAIFAASIVFLTGGLSLAASAAKAGTSKQPPATQNNSNSPTNAQRTNATTDPSYIIGPGDLLDINVWKEPDVSRNVPVRPDGRISLPLIDDVQAAGHTPLQLSESITQKLTKYLKNPQVTVIVTQINSKRIFVVGEVNRVGAMQLIPDMTVLQALASAGGFTPFANTKKIHVMRTIHGKQFELPFDYRAVLKGEKTNENIKLEPGDMIVVP